jgi:hypothetical protein
MPMGKSTGAERSKNTLDNGVWKWRIMREGFAFGKTQLTEEGYTGKGDEKIQLVVKVGDTSQNIIVVEALSFSDAAEWKRNEFLKAAGIYPGENVPYYLTPEMCIDLHGNCRTKNKVDGEYTNTKIDEWLEATEQHPERIPGFLMTEDAADAAARMPHPAMGVQAPDAEPIVEDDIPF